MKKLIVSELKKLINNRRFSISVGNFCIYPTSKTISSIIKFRYLDNEVDMRLKNKIPKDILNVIRYFINDSFFIDNFKQDLIEKNIKACMFIITLKIDQRENINSLSYSLANVKYNKDLYEEIRY